MNDKNKKHNKNTDRIPNMAFRIMRFTFKLIDTFRNPSRYLDQFGIEPGMTVVDYGCGPGRYIPKASALVGPKGKVIAADVHELALKYVDKEVKKWQLNNVEKVLVTDGRVSLHDQTADLIYALDMFHMVGNPGLFFNELQRIIKPSGLLILEDGHQSRAKSKQKVNKSGLWKIIDENERYMKCKVILDY